MSKYKYLVLLFVVIYAIIFDWVFIGTSVYTANEEKLIGTVNNLIQTDTYLKFELDCEEVLVVWYYLNDNNIILNQGDIVEVSGDMELIYSNKNFNLFNYEEYMNKKGIFYNLYADEITIIGKNNGIEYFLKNSIESRLNTIEFSSAYIKTFILGNKQDIDEEVMDSYQFNGIIHLFSISGMHIALFVGILGKMLNKTKGKNVIIIAFLMFYIIVTDFAIGVIRSSLMYILLIINKNFNLNLKAIDILVYLAAFLILLNHNYIYDVGFLFSFVVTFYLMYSNQLFKNKNYFQLVFLISYISFLAGLPILIYNFSSVNFMSIFFNIVFVPLVSFVILPISMLVFIFNISCLDYLLYMFINAMELLSKSAINLGVVFDFAKLNIWVVFLYYIVITLIIIGYKNNKFKPTFILVLMLFIHYNIRYFIFVDEIVFLDVGQGDSTLISYKNNKGNILVDTGGIYNYDLGKNMLVPYLRSIGVTKLDYLILTHGDFDHMGASLSLLEEIEVDYIIMNGFVDNELESSIINLYKEKVIKIDAKRSFSLNNNEFIIYNYPSNDENHDSLINLFYIEDFKVLLPGDASKIEERLLLKELEIVDIDILKVGHHGSSTSSDKFFIESIKNKYSVISAGFNNRYNHPTDDVLEVLKDSVIYRTDLSGAIKFKFYKNHVSITTV